MKKLLTGIISAFLVMTSLTLPANAKEVTADISPFSFNIVYTDFYNYDTQYPMLLYKNVSYLPLTSAMCNELYLSIAFDKDEGLYIARGGGRGDIGTERTEVLGALGYTNPKNGKIKAVVPEYPVYINGREYKSADYPVLNFRGITYLPLTYDIVACEFDFDFSFYNEKKHLVLSGNSWYSSPSFVNSTKEYIDVEDYHSFYSEKVNEDGTVTYHHEYDYTDYYRISLADDTIAKLPPDYKPDKPVTNVDGESDPRFSVRDGYAYFLDTQLLKLPGYGSGYDYISNASAKIYDYDGISFIAVTTWSSVPLPRGTTRRHHIFVNDDNGIKKLDWNCTFNGILYNGKDTWYLISNSGEQGYGNDFADIYTYTVGKGLYRLSDRYENINSLEYIGERDGKIYVFAALRYGNRNASYSGDSLNPMYSGYYEISENLELRKIAPYMGARAKTILAQNGSLYLITNYSTCNRIINLNTKEIIAEM